MKLFERVTGVCLAAAIVSLAVTLVVALGALCVDIVKNGVRTTTTVTVEESR